MAPDGVVEPAVPPDVADAAGRLLAVDRYPVAAEIIRTHHGAIDGLARVCDTVADRLAAEPHARIDRPDPALAIAMRAFLVRCEATPLDEVFPGSRCRAGSTTSTTRSTCSPPCCAPRARARWPPRPGG